MQKVLTLLVLGVGLVLVPARAAFAKTNILLVYFGPTTRLFNVNLRRSVAADYPGGGSGVARALAGANPPIPNQYLPAALNLSGAISTGALTLLLLQRRQRRNRVQPPRY